VKVFFDREELEGFEKVAVGMLSPESGPGF